jgi:hypothetical protein
LGSAEVIFDIDTVADELADCWANSPDAGIIIRIIVRKCAKTGFFNLCPHFWNI